MDIIKHGFYLIFLQQYISKYLIRNLLIVGISDMTSNIFDGLTFNRYFFLIISLFRYEQEMQWWSICVQVPVSIFEVFKNP